MAWIVGWASIGVAFASLLTATPAAGHAILLDSTPPSRSTIARGDVSAILRFNARIDPGRSRLTLIAADRSVHLLMLLPSATADVLATRFLVAAGHYTLRWQVLALDGHITRGDVPFTAGP